MNTQITKLYLSPQTTSTNQTSGLVKKLLFPLDDFPNTTTGNTHNTGYFVCRHNCSSSTNFVTPNSGITSCSVGMLPTSPLAFTGNSYTSGIAPGSNHLRSPIYFSWQVKTKSKKIIYEQQR